ncbi:hypothetical protein [Aliarcobacter butzleri]|uniref:hypothetical protein n=1 Tax=Aliarcobacter butzleri TaxID=28197 RepID=UPI0021B6243C|nr:hypothetical protein [Aliarcobacter butzleri]MCT7589048.1 hypothetical protein [Aliarcobacter butzleri]MDN5130175.1 hypothetical protein [Aliarcobacter butzleri]
MSETATNYIEKIMDYYEVHTITELSKILGIGQPAITKWKINNSILPIKKKCRELGIYNEIFGDLNSSIYNQTIRDNHGNNTQTGNVYSSKDNDDNSINIDEAALAIFKKAYNKCLDEDGNIIEDKIDELIIYLTKFK